MNLTYSSKMRRFLFLVPLLFFAAACAQTDEGVDVREPAVLATEASLPVENVVLITLDGLRWEEVFTGADAWLLENPKYTSDVDAVRDRFWRESPEERREALMPFFWSTIASQGRIHGNRALGSNVNVTNTRVFSYPGYNEILTGFVDEAIDSNDKVPNANETLLEWVNKQPGFEGKVTAFGSWDVFPYIINEERSGVPVNAGFEAASGELTEKEAWLNQLQAQTPSPWTSVRLDVFTHNYALESLKQDRPRLLYISYGETDDFAHDAEYRHYLDAAQRTDEMIRELWGLGAVRSGVCKSDRFRDHYRPWPRRQGSLDWTWRRLGGLRKHLAGHAGAGLYAYGRNRPRAVVPESSSCNCGPTSWA